jgi:N-methylhydantoinase B/oxoprolinase/acetone carboxylase alpha subunit
MEIKKGHTVYIKSENPKIPDTPTSGKVHTVGKDHVVLRTTGGTGYYKARKDNVSHDKNDSWLAKKYKKEEAPANVTAGVAKVDPLLGQKKKKMLKRFKDM